MSIAAQASFVAYRLSHGLAQGDAHVFHGVVTVDVQVALGFNREIDQTVAGNLIQHVVEKTDAGGKVRDTSAVQVERHADLGLSRVARHLCFAFHHRCCRHTKLAFKANIICSFSCGVPTVRRRQLCKSACILDTFLINTPRAFKPANTAFASGTRSRIILA